MIARLSRGAETADVPFPLLEDTRQRLRWGVDFLDDLDETCRHAFEGVIHGWPGHLFTLLDTTPGSQSVLATGLVLPDDRSAEGHDAFGKLLEIMMVASLSERLMSPLQRDVQTPEPFTSHEIMDARPALVLDVETTPSAEHAGRLISFTGHYCLALLENPPPRGNP